MKPVYSPYGSGYVSLIFQVQQLGITRLTPAPSRPCAQMVSKNKNKINLNELLISQVGQLEL
jgi:hypothetical protein